MAEEDNGQELGLGLPVAPGMLTPHDPKGFEILTSEELIELNTGYFAIKVHLDEQKDGTIRTQLELDSRPAFEVLLVESPLPTGATQFPAGTEPRVMLISKKRMENAFHIGDDIPTITKIPGGYDHSGGGVSREFMRKRIFGETGFWIDNNPKHLRCIGMAVGHTEIRTPIGLWICNEWSLSGLSREGVATEFVPLSKALRLADNAIQRTPGVERLENETGVELIYLFDRLFRRGDLSSWILAERPG
jgi:hypothetical protein